MFSGSLAFTDHQDSPLPRIVLPTGRPIKGATAAERVTAMVGAATKIRLPAAALRAADLVKLCRSIAESFHNRRLTDGRLSWRKAPMKFEASSAEAILEQLQAEKKSLCNRHLAWQGPRGMPIAGPTEES